MSLEPTPAQPSSPEPATQAPSPQPLAKTSGIQPGLVLAWLLAAVALTISLMLWQRLGAVQQQLARQSADSNTRAIEAQTLSRHAEELSRGMNQRLISLEGRQADMNAYRQQLDELVQTVARVRDENLPAELETALRLAQEQAQLTGSVELLQSALRGAERRLARSQDPRLLPVARALARDSERVRTTPVLDTAGLLARIDQLINQVDSLPTISAATAASPRPAADAPATPDAPPTGWWQQLWQSTLQQMQDLVRVREITQPDAALATPEQLFFVRENLKLRLHSARLALLARQYAAARADLAAAAQSIHRWFDPAARRTQAAATLLQNLQASAQAADLPRIEESLSALANAASLIESLAIPPEPAADADADADAVSAASPPVSSAAASAASAAAPAASSPAPAVPSVAPSTAPASAAASAASA